MTNPLERRLLQIDSFIPLATVNLAELPQTTLNLAHDLCQHFDLQLGSLIRRASAIMLADGENAADVSERLQEAAQHLILR
jgi:hypothetical protein